MKGYLGEFEELVLLTIASFGSEAYGVVIKKDIEQRTNRSLSVGALHSTLTRLEEKKFVTSSLGGATQERGGRRKRYFKVTSEGKIALSRSKELRDKLWDLSKINLKTVND